MNRDLLNYNKAAAYLDISPHTLRSWVKKRKIPYLSIGRNHRFLRADLDEFLRLSRQDAVVAAVAYS